MQSERQKMEKKGRDAELEKKFNELRRNAAELYNANQKMANQMQMMRKQLESNDFDYASFFLSMLFKVTEHPEQYRPEFVKWTVEHIENALISFNNAIEERARAEQEALEAMQKQQENAEDGNTSSESEQAE